MFEAEYDALLRKQVAEASGLRKEQLQKDLIGTRKLLEAVVYPVLRSLDGLRLEHDIVTSSGVRMYIDVFYEPLQFAFESEGYVAHAESITRDRFDFERTRIRTIAMYGYRYIPFSWDELDKKAPSCRRTLYELLGRYSRSTEGSSLELGLYEREVIRSVLRLNGPFRLHDVCVCLGKGPDFSRKVLKSLIDKKLVRPHGNSTHRHHTYILDASARSLLL